MHQSFRRRSAAREEENGRTDRRERVQEINHFAFFAPKSAIVPPFVFYQQDLAGSGTQPGETTRELRHYFNLALYCVVGIEKYREHTTLECIHR